MNPLPHLKRGVRAAIAEVGGIDGAAATVEKARTTVGDWNSRSQTALPTLGDAYTLDEIAVISGHRPEILTAYARLLGHVAIRLPDPGCGEDALGMAMIDASAEFGDIATALRDATRDGHATTAEREAIALQCDEAVEAIIRLKRLAVPSDDPRGTTSAPGAASSLAALAAALNGHRAQPP